MLTSRHNCVPFNANVIWCVLSSPFFLCGLTNVMGGCSGLIGSTRQFGTGTVCHGHVWAILVGVFPPMPLWWCQRRFPNSRLNSINIHVFLNGPTYTAAAVGINYSSWFLAFVSTTPLSYGLCWIGGLTFQQRISFASAISMFNYLRSSVPRSSRGRHFPSYSFPHSSITSG